MYFAWPTIYEEILSIEWESMKISTKKLQIHVTTTSTCGMPT